ncbi:MAG: ABC transporter ATP-binding protein [Gemmatimonadetes bacterium]|nr:ABC transporter ATP-binding protein [Gemmatimonadota bacterium]MBI3566570.1 ABC transporter ATP-binding protein [Gemmatimonadota bacterium]
MIRFEGVTLRYPAAAQPAVRAVGFEAARGALTAVVGPNGSGKSTIVRALIGRLTPEQGRLTIDGDRITTLRRRDVARRIAVVPQREEPAFPISVRDFIALGRYPHVGAWTPPSDADAEAVAHAAARAGVEDFLARRTDELSGGEWQRVRIARALAQGGAALVLDEPTAFLDIAHEMGVFELLGALAHEGRAVLLVSHQLNLVARFASHIVLLHRGAVAAAGTPEEVMTDRATLERVYEWPLLVRRDAVGGAPEIVPLRERGTR